MAEEKKMTLNEVTKIQKLMILVKTKTCFLSYYYYL